MLWPAAVRAASSAVSALGGLSSGGRMRSADRALQHDMARKGIQIRVADAKAAGIHPLYALGAQVSSPTFTHGSAGKDAAAAIGGVGRAVAQYGRHKEVAKRQALADAQALRESNSRLLTDEVQRQYITSNIAVNAQRLNQTGFGRKPLYVKMYDNRGELGSLDKGEMFLVGEQVAEQLEGMGALGMGIYGTSTAEKRDPKLLDAYRWMRGEGKYKTRYRVKPLRPGQRRLKDVILRR